MIKNTLPKKNQGYFLVLIAALFVSAVFSSCKKESPATEDPAVSFVRFVHSTPKYTSLDFYLAGVRTNSALLYTQSSSSYGGFYSGKAIVQVGIGGTPQELTRSNIEFAPYTNYSIFTTTASAASDTDSLLVLADNLTAPSNEKAKIRFVNISRGTPSLDLSNQGGSVLISNRAYNASSDFIEVSPGTYTFQTRDTGTSTVRASSQQAEITAGRIYTIWAGGSANGSANAGLGLYVMLNK